MRKLMAPLVVACMAYPLLAWAQSPIQVKYCNALADSYRKARLNGKSAQPNAGYAVAQCPTNPDESIPTLETALKTMGVDLPSR